MRVRGIVIATTAALALAAQAFAAGDRHSSDPSLRSGMTGQQISSETVRQLQQALQSKGHNVGEIDGVMGPRTQQALRDYQQSQGLSVTGRADQRTMSSLGLTGGRSTGSSMREPAANAGAATGAGTGAKEPAAKEGTGTTGNVGAGAMGSNTPGNRGPAPRAGKGPAADSSADTGAGTPNRTGPDSGSANRSGSSAGRSGG